MTSDSVELSSSSIAPYSKARDSRGAQEWDALFFTLEGTVHPEREEREGHRPGGDGPDPGSSKSASC